MCIPSSWSGGGSQLRVRWHEGAQPILQMLQRAVTHTSCQGRDGTFCIHEIQQVNVWRVENMVLWKRYVGKVQEIQMVHRKRGIKCRPLDPPVRYVCDRSFPDCLQWQQSFKRSCNEVLLWHGTRQETIQTIAKAGLDERVCNLNGMLGAGLYFAEDSCKSGQYAACDNNMSSWFILSRVVLGNPYYTQQGMQEERRAPDRYDSVVFTPSHAPGVLGHHRELVVYDRAQVYPEYIVEARRA